MALSLSTPARKSQIQSQLKGYANRKRKDERTVKDTIIFRHFFILEVQNGKKKE